MKFGDRIVENIVAAIRNDRVGQVELYSTILSELEGVDPTSRDNLKNFILLILNLPAGERLDRIKSKLQLRQLKQCQKQQMRDNAAKLTLPLLMLCVNAVK